MGLASPTQTTRPQGTAEQPPPFLPRGSSEEGKGKPKIGVAQTSATRAAQTIGNEGMISTDPVKGMKENEVAPPLVGGNG